MLITVILTLIMCVLLFLMVWSAVFFLPWKGLMDFFPEDIKEKAKDHAPPFKTAPIFGWICMILCMLGFIGVIVYGGWDGVQRGYTFTQFLVRFWEIPERESGIFCRVGKGNYRLGESVKREEKQA